MTQNDDQLIQACRQGDERAWERVLDKYQRLVYSIALNHGLTLEDAADVTQTTFTILLQSLDKLRENTRLAPWLTTVAKRHTWRRMKRRRREMVGSEEDIAGDERLNGRSSDQMERWERIAWINDGLNTLDARCRELLLSLYFDPKQPSYAQIAQQFDMAVGSVGPTRARCLERLKEYMLSDIKV